MDKIKIIGGRPLFGQINIAGSKNAALPIMAASLLTSDSVILSNIPNLDDIVTMTNLLINHGVDLKIDGTDSADHGRGRTILLNAGNINNLEAPYEIVRKMRASILVLGPLLARFGEAKVSLPGGCAIGTRPVDLHIKALEKMGAVIEIENGYIKAKCPKGLQGATIHFDKVSVGATENIAMAATLANGKTTIHNAAFEPEITDLLHFLESMGAKIKGIGTNHLEIEPVAKLSGCHHKIMPDRIEAGTYALAAAITKGEIDLIGINPELISNISDKIEFSGTQVSEIPNGVKFKSISDEIKPIDITTQVYPGFPTDMQAQMMALMTLSSGSSIIREDIFENRFMHVPELCRMGADISVSGSNAIVRGVKSLVGAEVMATDLRASVSLVLAALAAKGESVIGRVYHIDRGYEFIEDKLSACGALISRVKE